jgi:hypothetical protein
VKYGSASAIEQTTRLATVTVTRGDSKVYDDEERARCADAILRLEMKVK